MKKTILNKILIVEDDKKLQREMARSLRKAGYQVTVAEDGLEGLGRLEADRPDLLVLNRDMPRLDGLDACRIIRNGIFTAHLPILMISSRDNPKEIVEGFESGADDYLAKPFDLGVLKARVSALMRRAVRDFGSDPLTRLPGNALVRLKLNELINEGEPFYVFYTDIDNLKFYNEKYGYEAGDEVIKVLGTIISDVAQGKGRRDDFIGHLYDDDFILISSASEPDAICRELVKTFDGIIPRYYSDEDAQRGLIEMMDENGIVNRAPLLSISIVVIRYEKGRYRYAMEMAEDARNLMKSLQMVSGSKYVIHRGRGSGARSMDLPRE